MDNLYFTQQETIRKELASAKKFQSDMADFKKPDEEQMAIYNLIDEAIGFETYSDVAIYFKNQYECLGCQDGARMSMQIISDFCFNQMSKFTLLSIKEMV